MDGIRNILLWLFSWSVDPTRDVDKKDFQPPELYDDINYPLHSDGLQVVDMKKTTIHR